MTRRLAPGGLGVALVLALVAGTVTAPATADGLRVSAQAASWRLLAQDKLSVWANSPEANLVVDNRGQRGFLTLSATFDNILAGSFLSTPEGVVVGTSRDGSPIAGSLTASPAERQEWALRPNLSGAYRFAVLGGTRAAGPGQNTYGTIARDVAAKGMTFAIHLGDAVTNGNKGQMEVFREQLRSFPFPTYAVPGNHEVAGKGRAEWTRLFGSMPVTFKVAGDRFIMLDNASGRIERKHEDWLLGALARADDEHARNVFVFLHTPLVDVRPGVNQGMRDLTQVRRLLRVFRQHHVHSVYAGHIPMFARERRFGVTYVTTAGGGERPVVPAARGGYHHWVRVDVDAGGNVAIAPVKVP